MIRLDDLIQATGGRLAAPPQAHTFADFCYDSRIAEPGQLFLAVVTDTGDGHEYIHDACARGVTGVLCQALPPAPLPEGVTWIVVENTQQALLAYAEYVLCQRQVEVVGITGSVGKTSTKEAVAAVLGVRQPVFRNQGSYNGRYGLPIALGQLGDERLAVLEMAADSFDEIRLLAQITRPQVGVVTRVGHSHIADLGSLKSIAAEKGRLVEALPPEGVAVLNRDDPLVRAMAERTQARVVTYGLSPDADLWAEQVRTGPEGTRCRVHLGGGSAELAIPWIGMHHAYTTLVACAVGWLYGLEWEEIAAALAGLSPLPGRLQLLPGMGGSHLLDDTFSASPESTAAALEALVALPARRRWVVLGDMADLGAQAEEAHREIGRLAAGVADRLVTKGELAELAGREAVAAGLAPEHLLVSYADAEILETLAAELAEGDLVLIKGSAEARLERVVASLLAEGLSPEEVLPRQHPGWQAVRLRRPGRPTWVEIDLGAIANNTRRILARIGPGVELMAVLKADAYGHGAVKVARTVLNSGGHWLGVACLGEAIELRRAGITAPILNLGFTPAWQARDAVRHQVTSTVFALDVAEALARAGRDLGRPAGVHVKVDTGMGRLGLLPEEATPFVARLQGMEGLVVDGLFSHLAAADEGDLSYTRMQLERFASVVAALRAQGTLPPRLHIANSAAALRLPESHYNLVRVGIALYGLSPSAETSCPPDFTPALAFKCQVAQVKELPPGSAIGYGCTYRTTRRSRIAVIPVGYADGFRRAPRTWEYVLVRGQRAPLVGRVCMDQTMLDVTDIPGVREGDEVVLIGTQGREALSVDDVARQLGTINYEVISQILARVPRIV